MRSFDVDFLSMGQAANLYFQNVKPEKTTEPNKEVVSFQDVLNAKVEQEVKFSKHANQRLENRNIELSKDQLERLNQGWTGTDKADSGITRDDGQSCIYRKC